ncbi:MucB/RseB C-terminal domain-containing protein [Alloalcanivorax marinus]|uniref:MucB/RseB C-terminal domain-containing protein n=1 Tax=Alloalcanivorax marinus TaxID=1177169 RepID=UPI0021D25542|nr:MucB/RseB C-terminal domain-containing protein [Alloalcanivorax marinus]MCU5785310.1 negative regulator for alginate biosynthesis [Alloalcanivorax marinus]
MMRILALGLTLTAAPLAIADSLPAQSLLERMTEATQELDYQGRFLYQLGGEVSTMEIRHAVIDGEQYQRFTHLDGRLVEVLRLGDELVCLHPNGTLTRIDDQDQGLLSFRQRLSSQIPDQYNVLVDGDGRVAGRATTRMRVAPLDNHRYGYRLWLDNESHLLLKSEMVDPGGLALERVEFVTLDLQPGLDRGDFELPKVIAERALEPVPGNHADRVHVNAGWLPGGFRAADSDWRRVPAERQPVAAQSYSDGLATFTVFVENLDNGVVEEGVSRIGPTVAISRSVAAADRRYLLTLVGEIPQPTAERIMQGLDLDVAGRP